MPGGERHVDVPAQQVDLEPARLPVAVAQQHDGRGVLGLDRLTGAVGERAGVLDEVGRAAGGWGPRVPQTSTTSSTSTGASSGQHRDADGAAGVLADVAEHLAEQLRGAVGDAAAGR